jgi:hypothetical protein
MATKYTFVNGVPVSQQLKQLYNSSLGATQAAANYLAKSLNTVNRDITNLRANPPVDGPTLKKLLDKQASLIKQQSNVDALLNSLKPVSTTSGNASASTGTSKSLGSKPPPKPGPMRYNIPSVQSSYFNSAQFAHNFPNIGITNALQELWTDASKGSKGMLKTWLPPKGVTGNTVATNSNDLVRQTSNLQEYGFQFLYNPSTISVNYAAKDMGVDIGYELSGQDKSTPIQGTGSIAFQVFINRTFDLAVLNSDGTFKGSDPRYRSGSVADLVDTGVLPPPSSQPSSFNVYGVDIDPTELKKLAKKGTMYDLEYLFYTLVGWDIKTQLRGTTPDFGVLLNRKVEIHLGAPIRYLGFVSNLDITHTIFNENMIPMFTTVNFSIVIIPDPDGNWAAINGGSGANNSAGAVVNPTAANLKKPIKRGL